MKIEKTENSFNKVPKLELLASSDELRPGMFYMEIKKGCVVMTDGHLLAKVPLKYIPLFDGIELPENPVYIHKEDWKVLTDTKVVVIELEGNHLQVVYGKNKPNRIIELLPEEKFQDKEGNFPVWETVIPEDNVEPVHVPHIGLNLDVTNRVNTAFKGCFQNTWKLKFYGTNRAVHFIPIEHPMGTVFPEMQIIQMPVMTKKVD